MIAKLSIATQRVAVVLVLIFSTGFFFTANAQPPGQEEYTVGGRQSSESTYKAAQAVSAGLTLLNNNQPQAAVSKFREAVLLDPGMFEAHHNLGYALTKLGRTDEAIEEYKKALQIKDTEESTWLCLGGLYQSSGQLSLAIATLNGFLNRFPASIERQKIQSLVQGLAQEQSHRQFQPNNATGFARSPDYFRDVITSEVTRWPSSMMPLKVYVADGTSIAFYRPEFSEMLRQAFLDWSQASAGLITFAFVEKPYEANIECNWVSNPTSLTNSAEAGEAVLTKNGGVITRAYIKVLTVPLSPELPLTPNRMKAFCLHEIGHVLGLEGHSADPADIMFLSAVLSDNPRVLSARDRNTLLHLYSVTTP